MTTPAVPDLITWLRAVLDAREREIRARHLQICGHDEVAPDDACNCDDHVSFGLAEVDAKRRILDWLEEDAAFDMPAVKAQAASREEWYIVTLARTTIKLLALPYADRPGYRDEWRPA